MTVLSDIAIANMALGHLGRSAAPIPSFNDRSVEARIASTWYDQSRREVLETHDWSFARRRQALAVHSEDPPDAWAYRYQMPADCLVFRLIWNPLGESEDVVPFELEVDATGEEVTILTDVEDAIGIYTRDVTLVQMFTPLFVNALAHYMAWKMAYAITSKAALEDREMKAAHDALRAAAASDANQSKPPATRDAYSIRARA